jgi:outer membrane protein OmpA-like peptidoglycan-associated protein
MKLTKLTYLSLSLLVGLSITSCDLMKDVTYSVAPNPLEMHGDSVAVTVTVNVPAKGLKKKAKVEITPVLGTAKLDTWTIQGEKATANGQSIAFKAGGTATFEDVIAYDPSMEAADLKLTGKIYKGVKEKDALPETKIADGTVITPLLVQPAFRMLMAEDKLVRSNEKSVSAEMNYEKGKSDVRANEIKDKDIIDLVAWVVAAQSNPKIVINSIDVKGFASPDGEEIKNSSLSIDRSKSGRKAFMDLMKKAKMIQYADSSKYSVNGLGEDFIGFKDQLARTTSISEADKNLFIRILEMSTDAKQRETEMINLGKSYTQLDKEVFPKIRRAVITVNYTENGLTDEELKTASVSNPNALTIEELLFTAANLATNINEKAAIYAVAANNYPADYRGHNNLGAVKFIQNMMPDAKKSLETANNISDNGMTKNNLAGVAMANGDRALAKKLLAQVKDKSTQLAYNNAVISILEGKYSAAVSSFGAEASFNKALAQVLQGNLDDASKTLAASSDKESADGYYLKAIIAARSNAGVDAVVSSLKLAFAKNSDYKSKAGRDREFIKLMSDASFSAAIN